MLNSKEVTIPEGRDKGKAFLVTEMSPWKAEKWAIKFFLALGKSEAKLPDGVERAGFAGVFAMGIKMMSEMKFNDAEPLMDEMMDCVQYMVKEPGKASYPRKLDHLDIEDVSTIIRLRKEVWDLHSSFMMGGFQMILASMSQLLGGTPRPPMSQPTST